MKYRNWIFIILPLLVSLFAESAAAYEKLPDGILFTMEKRRDTDPRSIKIQVCSDEIIRVIASPETTFSTRHSLIVAADVWKPVAWTVREKDGRVTISTSKMSAAVDPVTGAVEFRDSGGGLLLSEKKEGGKIISPATVLGEQTYHIRQLFESPSGEAFYGLGAHQNGVMNYRGHDVDLWQYNIVDVNPFLVSSRNFGILWDNYSRTKFGDVRDYQSLSNLTLFGKDGRDSGLTAEYYRDAAFDSLYTSRRESKIEHEFTDVNDIFPDGFNRNVAAVRWSGEIESSQSGVHKFRLYACGYTKMWLNGELVVDSWRQNWLPWTHNLTLAMEAGKRYKIKIDWIHTGGYIGLSYLTPDTSDHSNTLSLYSEVADQIDYYFIAGKNIDDVIRGYRRITGTSPMMPKWAMGLWQSRERYQNQKDLLSVTGEFRRRNIPLDVIVQDWFYWKEDRWGDHEFDTSRFPDPEGMIRTLHDSLHTRIMISVWPKFYTGTKNYEEFRQKGWLYMRNIEKGQRDWVGPGYVSTFFDPYGEGARALNWKQMNEKLFSKGIDAWWLDSTEPDIQSNLSRTETILRQGPTALGSASRYLNTYSLMQVKGVYEGQRKTKPDQRAFILTRSAFAGQQRYPAATWSGDIAARWEDLKNQIPAGLNFSISGIPYWTTDIGGFAVEQRYERPNESDKDEWRELNTRWFQFGTFCPLLRVHGQYPYREMFNIAPETHPAYQAMLAYDRLRYRLMPYIYSLAGMVTRKDYTIMRALVMDFGSDTAVLNIGDEFMFGPAFLINPVTQYRARTRSVYLPSGTGWYEMRSGKYHDGGKRLDADAPYSDIPIFVREGSIITCGPEIQYATQKPADTLRLFVYTGSDGSFTLYEDEGVNYNYEKGKYSTIELKYDDSSRRLTIGQRKGKFRGMPAVRRIEITWIGKNKPAGLDFRSRPDRSLIYNGTRRIVRMN